VSLRSPVAEVEAVVEDRVRRLQDAVSTTMWDRSLRITIVKDDRGREHVRVYRLDGSPLTGDDSAPTESQTRELTFAACLNRMVRDFVTRYPSTTRADVERHLKTYLAASRGSEAEPLFDPRLVKRALEALMRAGRTAAQAERELADRLDVSDRTVQRLSKRPKKK
jgi:hypothetical protein